MKNHQNSIHDVCKTFCDYNFFKNYLFLLEKFFLEDPDLQDKVPVHFASHKDKYNDSIRKATVIFNKLRELQNQGKDGVDNYM